VGDSTPDPSPATHGVSLREAVIVWALIGLQSFGGPAGQIAVMHRILVQERRWVSERRFLHALNYCMLLPGPEAMQLATYVGWLMHRTLGGLIAGMLAGFFSFAAAVTFGGAYAVLAFVAQQAVETYGWLKPGEMLDGLGMAETTPGPLIQVVQFVGFMGAHRDATASAGSALNPFVAGTIASVVVTWVTFAPCFLWIFVGGPFIESVRKSRRISAALSAITAAVVGVILNLACWFAVHTLFRDVEDYTRFGMRVPIPDPTSIDIAATAIGTIAATMIFIFKRGMITTIATCAALGVLWTVFRN